MDGLSCPRTSLKLKRPRVDAICQSPLFGHGRFPAVERTPQIPAKKAAQRNHPPPAISKESASKDCVARKQDLTSIAHDISAQNRLGKPSSSVSQGHASLNARGTDLYVGSVSKNALLHRGKSREDYFPGLLKAISKVNVGQMRSNVNLGNREFGWGQQSSGSSRAKVKEVLELYRETLAEVFKDYAKANKRKGIGPYLAAAMLLKSDHKWLNTSKGLGSIPGVEIGDQFLCRAELYVVGLHCQFQSGIDYTKKNGIVFATSIVASEQYANYLESSDVLIYSGHGGNPHVRSKQPLKDQSLERGNLALKNSMDSKYPVRVIRKTNFKNCSVGGFDRSTSSKSKFVYDGLYMVEEYWQERGLYGKLVFKFRLVRIEFQDNLASK